MGRLGPPCTLDDTQLVIVIIVSSFFITVKVLKYFKQVFRLDTNNITESSILFLS